MRRRVFRIDPQRGFVMRARLGVLVGAKQQVGEVDMRHRICRMVQDRLRIDAAGGVDRAHIGQQRPEFVERAEMGRAPGAGYRQRPAGRPARRLSAPSRTARSISVSIGVARGHGAPADRRAAAASTPAPAGAPSIDRCAVARAGREGRVLFQSGHDARWSWASESPLLPRSANSRPYRESPIARDGGQYCRIFPLPPSETSGSKFPAATIPNCSGGRILFTKNLHGRFTSTATKRQSDDRVSHLSPGRRNRRLRTPTQQLRIGLEHHAAGRIDEAMPPISAVSPRPGMSRPDCVLRRDDCGAARQSRQCLHGSRRSRIGGRKLQGGIAAGAASDVLLVQPRQCASQDREARRGHRALSSGADAQSRAIGHRAPTWFRP